MLDMTEDHLLDKLFALCGRFAEDPIDGRYEVAKRAKLSEQYLYQLLTKKPMANGNMRSIGKIARKKITDAFPDWLVQDPNTSSMPAQDRRFLDALGSGVKEREIPEHIRQTILTLIDSSPKKGAP